MTFDDIVKFTKDDKMRYLVVKYTNGCFYGFNLVVKNNRQTATNLLGLIVQTIHVMNIVLLILNHMV